MIMLFAGFRSGRDSVRAIAGMGVAMMRRES
jgi:hypothetical protein